MAAGTIQASQPTKDDLRDPFWRWNNLYWIRDESGATVRFSLRPAIEQFVHEMHTRNIILKARQLGFSTFILIYILDCLLFKGGLSAAIVAHRLDSAKRLFREKIAFPYNHLPESIRKGNPIVSGGSRTLTCAASQELQLANGSSLIADTSVRSGTYQYVHLSEYGPLCADSPVRALEVKTGTLETAHADSVVFIESTAKGQAGHFYDLCQGAQERAHDDPSPLDNLEFKFHFFPWFRNPSYVANPAVVRETAEQRAYFDRVETIMDVTLTPEQRAWYILKKRVQKGAMWSEHPSTPEEAFQASVQGAYYSERLALLADRGQIGSVPHLPGYAVHTAWDIGYTTAVWFWQQRGPGVHIIRYHEAQGWGMPEWGQYLDQLHAEHGYRYGTHFAPFDSKTQNGVKIIVGQSILDAARSAGIMFEVLPLERSEVKEGIPRALDLLPLCYFDADACSVGLGHLRTFHESINSAMSTEDNPVYTGKPADGPECHGADAFRYLSMAVPRLDGPSDYYQVAGRIPRPQSCMAG